MIIIKGVPLSTKDIDINYPPTSVESKSLDILQNSRSKYNYRSVDELKFDLKLKAAVVESARELDASDMDFKIFTKTRCNKEFWKRMNDGGFLLKDGVSPYDAIRDIFKKGGKYGTECATAIIIVYYGALTKVMTREVFDSIYPSILLMNWQDVDEKLGVDYYDNINDKLPGECRYFKNPEVNPKTPEWQGENVIDLGDGFYFGHGLGIKAGEEVIDELNKKRKKGATETAYLLDHTIGLNAKYLYRLQKTI